MKWPSSRPAIVAQIWTGVDTGGREPRRCLRAESSRLIIADIPSCPRIRGNLQPALGLYQIGTAVVVLQSLVLISRLGHRSKRDLLGSKGPRHHRRTYALAGRGSAPSDEHELLMVMGVWRCCTFARHKREQGNVNSSSVAPVTVPSAHVVRCPRLHE